MAYCFRLRFDLNGLMRVGADHRAHVLEESDRERVTLAVVEPDQHDGNNQSSVVLVGCGYGSTDVAREAGRRWTALLQRAFASLDIGADLGRRRTTAGWASKSGAGRGPEKQDDQQHEELLSGVGFLYDEPGLTLFEEDPWPTFAQLRSSGWAGLSPSVLVDAVAAVRSAEAPLSPVEQTAYDLYSSSFSAVSSDARFIVLMMALETLVDPQPRDAQVVGHVNTLIEQTQQSGLPDNEVRSLVGSLKYLLQESIGQAGRRLTRILGTRRYMDLAPGKFFTRCYTLRSRLVHGAHPRPEREEIDSYAPELERLVSGLLTAPLRDAGLSSDEQRGGTPTNTG